jgi:hypothetical protein
VIANHERIDGLDVIVQDPLDLHAEAAYLHATAKTSYEQMVARLLELLYHQLHRRLYRKRTELVIDIVRQLEAEGQFPQADYAFDNGMLTVDLTLFIEQSGKHWGRELECLRHINWRGQWGCIDHVATALREQHPESFRPVTITCRNGKEKPYWGFTKVVRLKMYGEKRVMMVHEQEDLQDSPRFFMTDAKHWEGKRILETWSYRWTSEVFHEFAKQVRGMEAAQVRKEEAVTRHCRLSCVAQSLLQRTPASGAETERFAFAQGTITIGQRVRTIAREALQSLLKLVEQLLAQGQSCEHILEVLMPA